MRTILSFLILTYSTLMHGQQPPGTEIYLLQLSVKKSKITISDSVNITHRAGYDNQPSFHPDKPILYFSSANADGITDIKEYNLETRTTKNFTATTEREYSPTVTPDQQFISCIIQRDNGAQDLGKYPINGGDAVVVINTLTVGYHAWMNESQLLLFVLGDTLTLHHYNLANGKDKVVAKRIGRSLHKIPKSNDMSLVHKVSDQEWFIKKLKTDGSIETITQTLAGREDLAWTPDGRILMSDGKSLFYFWPGKTDRWQEIKIPAMPGTITRLAINKKGNALAMVVSE